MTTAESITIPEDASQLEEFLHDTPKVMATIKAGTFQNVINAYAKASLRKDEDLVAQFREEMQLGLVNFMKEQGTTPNRKITFQDVVNTRKTFLNAHNKGQVYNKNSVASKLDNIFNSPSDFFRASCVDNALRSDPDAERLQGLMAQHRAVIRNAASSTVPADGGFLIPEILRSEIMTLMLEDAVVRPYATVIPMDSLKVPIPAVDETTRVGSIYGGINFSWTAEGGAGVDSSAKFAQVVLDAKKLFGYAAVPRELMADSPAFDAWFGQKFPQAAGYQEDDAFLNGTGAEQPMGVLTSGNSALISVNPATSSKVAYDDIVQMYARMYPASHRRAIWICAPDVLPQLMELTFTPSGGTTPVPVMLWQPNAQAVPTPTILGRPLVISEKAPKLGADNALSYIDLSEYLIGDRQQMLVDTSEHYLFGNDKIAVRIIERVDGRPWVQSAITPRNGSTSTLSPYVGLAGTHV